MEIAISEFKARCIQLLKSTAESGEELVVALHGQPVARITGIPHPPKRVLNGQPDALTSDVSDRILIDSNLEADWES